jgi:hypothetical protein
MPEYLAPGVYVEEVSFRSKTIEGVPTSTTGYAGMTRFGPVPYAGGPTTTEPRLITSFTEFETVYGGLEDLRTGDTLATEEERRSYLAHAARAFFLNGGKRLYVSRVFVPRDPVDDLGVASRTVSVPGGATATWRARWPGAYGNVWLDARVVRSRNIAYQDANFGGAVQAKGVKPGAVVEIVPAGTTPPSGNDPLTLATLAEVDRDPTTGAQIFRRGGGMVTASATDSIQLVELTVEVRINPERSEVYTGLATSNHREQKRYVGKILQRDDPEDENAVVWLDWTPSGPDAAARLMVGLQANTSRRLENGNDGRLAAPSDLRGREADPDDATLKATGLEALGEIEDIAIVALPDGGTYGDPDLSFAAADALIAHAERARYRIAVVDAPEGSSLNEVRAFRGRFDSKYAALYHPWVEVFDPLSRPAQGAPPDRILLPPSGFVTGIYARNDVERGVHKAPANEIVRGLTKFEANINKARQDVLNPEGINALRFFEGRGNRVWGARTLSSDPEWRYVNVRRLFIYLEHSIDKGSQWAVFEPNDPRLWANLRQTVSDFLFVLWRDGALLGTKPEEAYFVRCDRTTMTQNDIDNGRVIVLIGVAPVKPAEFVIFRVGQFTAGARES